MPVTAGTRIARSSVKVSNQTKSTILTFSLVLAGLAISTDGVFAQDEAAPEVVSLKEDRPEPANTFSGTGVRKQP